MTFNELRAELSRLVADDTLDFANQVDRDRWLNLAYQEVNKLVRPVKKYVEQVVPPLQASLALPDDFMGLAESGITWMQTNSKSSVVLRRINLRDADYLQNGWQTARTGHQPRDYSLEPNLDVGKHFITFHPMPTVSARVFIEYYPQVVELVNALDKPFAGLFPEHHTAIAHYAEIYWRQQEQDFEAEARAVQRAKGKLDEFAKGVEDLSLPRFNMLQGVRHWYSRHRRGAYD